MRAFSIILPRATTSLLAIPDACALLEDGFGLSDGFWRRDAPCPRPRSWCRSQLLRLFQLFLFVVGGFDATDTHLVEVILYFYLFIQ